MHVMSHRNVVLYIATSAEGYIARPDGDLDFLSVVEQAGEDYGYSKFINTVDTVIMGRKTYDKVLSFGIEFPHKARKCYVWSQSRQGNNENVTYFSSSPAQLIADLRKEAGKDIFIDGGAELVHELMKEQLIDRYIISVVPYFIGNGVRLFKSGTSDARLSLTHSVAYPSGLVQLWYEPLNG